jgi:hypothetical protein
LPLNAVWQLNPASVSHSLSSRQTPGSSSTMSKLLFKLTDPLARYVRPCRLVPERVYSTRDTVKRISACTLTHAATAKFGANLVGEKPDQVLGMPRTLGNHYSGSFGAFAM